VVLAAAGGGAPVLPAAEAAGPPPASSAISPPPVVTVENRVVSVDAVDAEMADVLSALAQQAGFQLTISGQLGRVTAAFTRASVEEALRRLVQDHELMLVYGAPAGGHGPSKLLRVDVFASTASRWGSAGLTGTERATTLAEISQLLVAQDREHAARRLGELLGTPDATVRARSAWALGRVGGPQAVLALVAATRDQAPEVRVQAVYALGSVEAARAIPTLGDLLLRDPAVLVRRAAARTLGTLPDAAAVSALSAATQDGDTLVRREVASALRRRGVPVSP
jgi:hypothetical protein